MGKQIDMFYKGEIETTSNDYEGSDYERKRDHARLSGQMLRIWTLMKDGGWRTLSEIEKATGDPQSSISAQLRHFRKPKWGSHQVDKENFGGGTWKYKLTINDEAEIV